MNMRTRHLPLALAIGAATLALPACLPDIGPSSGGGTSTPPVYDGQGVSRGDGRVYFRWTIDGQVPTDALCAGVDHLALVLDYDGGGRVSIAPIPCTLDRFRYDKLATG